MEILISRIKTESITDWGCDPVPPLRSSAPKLKRSVLKVSVFDIAWNPCYRAIMIRTFKNQGTKDIFDGKNNKKIARKICPRDLWSVAIRKLDQIDSVTILDDLKVPPGNRLEALSGNRKGQYSIRINEQYRICFVWHEGAANQVEIVDYHS